MDGELNQQGTPICPFCSLNENKRIITETKLAFAIYDRFPVNPGHSLVIPFRHVTDYFMLSAEEQHACWELVNQLKEIIDLEYRPDGYNIGINNMCAAGQTVPHVHIHLIPRYNGDVKRPHGGVRGVIPEKKEY